ncbi:MAG: hypothetical protein P8Y70_20410 [Candidatus Lokiarchaeota archaeon]
MFKADTPITKKIPIKTPNLILLLNVIHIKIIKQTISKNSVPGGATINTCEGVI